MLKTISQSLQIGPYQITAVPTGLFALDGGAMFGTVPKVLWEKTNPADHLNRISMEARTLLLDGGPGNSRILIDCGIGGDFIAKYGEKLGSKFAEIYGIQGLGEKLSESPSVVPDMESPSIVSSLKQHGIEAEDITHVILTHLHFDHAGGATTVKNSRLVPTFPKARYYVQQKNYETAKNPNIREKASYFSANFEPLQSTGCLELVHGDQVDLLPGVSVFVSDGHTVGQQWVKVSDGKTTLAYCGDVIPTSTHIRLPWVMGYDLEPLKLIEEKRKILGQAASEDWYLYFEHDPFMDAARIEAFKDDYRMKDGILLT